MKLFMRLKEVVQTLHSFDDVLAEVFRKKAKESAERLYMIFFDEFQRRVFIEKHSERKIVVRLPTSVHPGTFEDLPSEAALKFTNGFEIFQIEVPPNIAITWDQFIRQNPHNDISDIIRSLTRSARLEDVADDKQLAVWWGSTGRKRFFRFVVLRSVVYYSGIAEVYIYAVEV